MYTRCQDNALVCIAASSVSQCSIHGSTDSKKAARRRPLHVLGSKPALFGRFLAGRVEGAGIVDFGDLVVGEAEHLAQDFVGMLAEQR
jgi:hypothetical protein